MTIQAEIQKPSPSEKVELFQIDYSNLYVSAVPQGAGIDYLSPTSNGTTPIAFGGITYMPMPMQATGFERNSSGTLPSPTLSFADTSGVIGSLLRNEAATLKNRDLLGATVTRIVTFRKYLDDGIEPDGDAHLPLEVFRIDRKSRQNRFLVEFSLASVLDMEGIMLPRRVVLQDTCTFIYRTYDAETADFIYVTTSENACPYTAEGAGKYFDYQGIASTKANDFCGKKFSDCILRYPQPQQVPFNGFPGVANVRR